MSLDQPREQAAIGPLRVDLGVQAAVKAAEAAGDALEVGCAVHAKPHAHAALGLDAEGVRGRVLREHLAVEVPQGSLGRGRRERSDHAITATAEASGKARVVRVGSVFIPSLLLRFGDDPAPSPFPNYGRARIRVQMAPGTARVIPPASGGSRRAVNLWAGAARTTGGRASFPTREGGRLCTTRFVPR